MPTLAGLHGADQRRPLYSRFPALYFATPAWVKRAARSAFAARQGRIERLIARYLDVLERAPEGDGRPVPLVLKHLFVDFYPEGGDLVAGIKNRVYFQAQTPANKPAEMRGRLIDQLNNTVATFQTVSCRVFR